MTVDRTPRTGSRREPVVRAATTADLDAVAGIFAHYVTESVATFEQTPPTLGDWRRRLSDVTGEGLPFLVADIGGDVAGYAYAGPWRPKPAYRYTVEDSIYLAPGRTGSGLGSALLSALIADSSAAGMRQMIAVVADTGNGASTALHERFGFTEAGRLTGVGYKHGRWLDTVLMQRSLADGPDSGS